MAGCSGGKCNERFEWVANFVVAVGAAQYGLEAHAGTQSRFFDRVFALAFGLELAVRLATFVFGIRIRGCWHDHPCSAFTAADLSLGTVAAATTVVVEVTDNRSPLLSGLCALRVLRLFRILRTLQSVGTLPGLQSALGDLHTTIQVLFWAATVCLVIIYAFGVLCVMIARELDEEERFAALHPAMLSLLRTVTWPEWPPLHSALAGQHWMQTVAMFSSMLMLMLVMLNAVVGIFAERSASFVRAVCELDSVEQVEARLCSEACSHSIHTLAVALLDAVEGRNCGEVLTRPDLQHAAADDKVRCLLREVGLSEFLPPGDLADALLVLEPEVGVRSATHVPGIPCVDLECHLRRLALCGDSSRACCILAELGRISDAMHDSHKRQERCLEDCKAALVEAVRQEVRLAAEVLTSSFEERMRKWLPAAVGSQEVQHTNLREAECLPPPAAVWPFGHQAAVPGVALPTPQKPRKRLPKPGPVAQLRVDTGYARVREALDGVVVALQAPLPGAPLTPIALPQMPQASQITVADGRAPWDSPRPLASCYGCLPYAGEGTHHTFENEEIWEQAPDPTLNSSFVSAWDGSLWETSDQMYAVPSPECAPSTERTNRTPSLAEPQ